MTPKQNETLMWAETVVRARSPIPYPDLYRRAVLAGHTVHLSWAIQTSPNIQDGNPLIDWRQHDGID